MIREALMRLRRGLVPRERTHALIALTIVFGILLTIASWETVRAERKRVALATCFFAADASRVLQARSHAYLETAADPIFAAVGGTAPVPLDAPLPHPQAMLAAAVAVSRCHCVPELPSHTYFRFDVAASDGDLSKLAIASRIDSVAPVGLESDTIGLRTAIGRMLTTIRTGAVIAVPVTRTDQATDTLRMVAVVSAKFGDDGRVRAVYGLTISPVDFATRVVAPVFDQVPLFSWRLSDTNRLRNRDLAYLTVADYSITTLYHTGPIADTSTGEGCMGMAPVEQTLANVMLHIVPPAPVYSRWTSRNMAVSRLPFLALLLVGLVASGAAAAMAAKRQADLAKLRSNFVTSISHEVRTPLAQIMLASEALSLGRTRSQHEREEAADTIVRETHRLVGLVDNVLQFSRVEHYNIKVHLEPIDVHELVTGFLEDMEPIIRGARVTVTNTVPCDLTSMLDPGAFRQVLYNLVDNAIKYGPVGQHITIAASILAGTPDRVRVWVQDEGSGVTADEATAIFEPFVRLERDRRSVVAGSGLGLAVVRHLVEAHGGRVWVEPAPGGGGSRFVVEVALASEGDAARAPGDAARGAEVG